MAIYRDDLHVHILSQYSNATTAERSQDQPRKSPSNFIADVSQMARETTQTRVLSVGYIWQK